MRIIGKITPFALALLPSAVQIPIRRLLGQKIGKNAKIAFCSLILCPEVELGQHTRIGPFALIRCNRLSLGNNTQIKPLSIISTGEVRLGQYVHIAPLAVIYSSQLQESKIEIGDHSRIFPFCWIEPGQGVFIGRHVGVGGHSLIFTHGAWPNYLLGGPINYGPVKIEDNVWLPWRVFVLPNVTIGRNAIIGANSTINRTIPPNSLAAGSPARVIKESWPPTLAKEEQEERINEIISDYNRCHPDWHASTPNKISCRNFTNLKAGDLLLVMDEKDIGIDLLQLKSEGISVILFNNETAYIYSRQAYIKDFISFMRRYGIRLYLEGV